MLHQNGILRLGRDEVNEGQPWAGVNIHATVAQLREKKFAMAALPGHEDVDFASLARIATESSPDGVEPSRESLKVTSRGNEASARLQAICTSWSHRRPFAFPNPVCRRAWRRSALG